MKYLIKIICLCSVLFVFGCQTKTTYQSSDMSGYEGFTDTEHVFVDSNVKDFTKKMKDSETFVAYFGFANCPWCIEALPVLNEVGKEYESKIDYINTRENPAWKSNIDIDDYDLLVEMIGDVLEYDDAGIKHLYTPFVVFIKDGKLVDSHQGTTEEHDATERKMTEEEAQELRNAYVAGFEKLK